MSLKSSNTWLPKHNSHSSLPSRPSTSSDKTVSSTCPPVFFNVPPPSLPLSLTLPLSMSIPPPTLPPNWQTPPNLPTSPIWPSSTNSSLPSTISPDNLITLTSPSHILPGSTSGFDWIGEQACQLAEKLTLVGIKSQDEEEEDDLNQYEEEEDGSDKESTSANPRFKTEICRNIKEKGSCHYRDRCQFAHGEDEVRDVAKNNKYKTKHCQKYWINGFCAYGFRCNFVHYKKGSFNEKITMATPDAVIHKGKEISVDSGKEISLDDSGKQVSEDYSGKEVGVKDFGKEVSLDDIIGVDDFDKEGVNGSVKEVSVDDSGNFSLGSDSKSPTESPRLVESLDTQGKFFTPTYGSGRLVAKQHNNTFTWIDSWTQRIIYDDGGEFKK